MCKSGGMTSCQEPTKDVSILIENTLRDMENARMHTPQMGVPLLHNDFDLGLLRGLQFVMQLERGSPNDAPERAKERIAQWSNNSRWIADVGECHDTLKKAWGCGGCKPILVIQGVWNFVTRDETDAFNHYADMHAQRAGVSKMLAYLRSKGTMSWIAEP